MLRSHPTAGQKGLNRDRGEMAVMIIAGMVMVMLIVKGGDGGRGDGAETRWWRWRCYWKYALMVLVTLLVVVAMFRGTVAWWW